MLSGSGGTMNRFRVSSVADINEKSEEQDSQQNSFQLNTQTQSNIPLNATGKLFHSILGYLLFNYFLCIIDLSCNL